PICSPIVWSAIRSARPTRPPTSPAPTKCRRVPRSSSSGKRTIQFQQHNAKAIAFAFFIAISVLAVRPMDGVLDNLQRNLLLVNRISLVAGTEIKYLALAHFPRATAGEGLAVVPFFPEDHRVRLGDVERSAINLRLRNVKC